MEDNPVNQTAIELDRVQQEISRKAVPAKRQPIVIPCQCIICDDKFASENKAKSHVRDIHREKKAMRFVKQLL